MYKNNLYNIRVSKGLTQKDFAEELGMNPSLYSRYERGETNMSLEVAKSIADYCDISLDYLAGREEPDFDKIGEGLETIRNREEMRNGSSNQPSMKEIIEDWMDNKLEPITERLESIEKKLGSTQTDSQSEE
ncbi:Transcriptional regulator, contains XRE-family HTH domain [Ruminococcus sp. YE71]|uniref:helix-turn-helix domain-containing protein n=1 Tax=unclassified Ruminococcus TaxID=2608920 RepID=UPI000880390F|nr:MULTISPECIES: helix-turn-helix transcriptional regulator [unclassified Ruminococcus]SDA20963.1 Transcriptional regulator, contains XRE-family HTH domain [Ruminococcus sp. YE78]SFW33256.1 Transcriptional regulator, contains XRE-family HTH domain [Ruminococcus sp. YE71]